MITHNHLEYISLINSNGIMVRPMANINAGFSGGNAKSLSNSKCIETGNGDTMNGDYVYTGTTGSSSYVRPYSTSCKFLIKY